MGSALACARRTWGDASIGLFAALSLAGCAQSHVPDGTMFCPPLVVGEGADTYTYLGVVGRSDDLVPGSCVEVSVDGELRAHTHVTAWRTYALRFVVEGDRRGGAFDVRVERLESVDGPVVFEGRVSDRPSAALLGYEPPGPPASGGHVEVTYGGWLEPSPAFGFSRDPETVWMVNWSSGLVEPVLPTPRLDEPFEVTVLGHYGQELSPVSRHVELGRAVYGGCWWPRSPCIVACDEELIAPDPCWATGSCSGRGCTPVDADERRSRRPPPFSDDDGVRRRDAGPPMPDGSLLDAGSYDAGPPF